MKTNNAWQQDSEYVVIVEDLLAQPAVQRLAEFTQHHHSNRLDHSIAVSYDSYVLAKKWHLNTTAVARGGLLHVNILLRVYCMICFIMTGVKPSLISARTHLFIRG